MHLDKRGFSFSNKKPHLDESLVTSQGESEGWLNKRVMKNDHYVNERDQTLRTTVIALSPDRNVEWNIIRILFMVKIFTY